MGELDGLMQDDFPLSIQYLLRRMRTFPRLGSVTTLTDGGVARASHGDVVERIDRLARALQTLGIGRGDRVATFAFNTQRHFECYFAVPCIGAVLHTVNPRLFAEQIASVIEHAEDRIVLVDDVLVPLLAPLAERLPGVEHFIVMGDGPADGLPRALRYEELLAAAEPGPPAYPTVDEREAAALCYTSGTTGDPKGVLYSHRSSTLHAAGVLMSGSLGISESDRILLVVPMFHVNAWGLPYAAALAGSTLVLPGRHLGAEPLARAIESERCTVMACVPTIYADLLRYADRERPDLRSLQTAICGGAPMPLALAQAFEERHGVRMIHAWGMTETSPMCTVARVPATGDLDAERAWQLRATQGRPVPFVDLRLVDTLGEEVAWDGSATGEIEVRGPWIARSYYRDDDGSRFDAGWLRTGDIAHVEPEGWVQITDRAKDVIKSGGEWISSVELENQLMAHPAVREAAVIAMPDERWGERPLACVVIEASVGADELREHLAARVAKWWLPDEFAFLDELPKTSVGKFDKKVLRAALAEGRLEARERPG